MKRRTHYWNLVCALVLLGSTAYAQENADKAPKGIGEAPYLQMLRTGGSVPLLLLDTADRVWALQVTSGSQLFVRRGNAMVNSKNKGALWAAGGLIQVDNGAVGVVGGTTTLGENTLKPTPRTGFTPMADPFPAFEVDQKDMRVVLGQKLTHSNGDLSLKPGIYEGGIWVTARDATVTMEPGVYVFRGCDFAVWHSRLIGEGVTIVMVPSDKEAGSFSTQFGAQVQLSAPTSGPLQGLVVLSAAKGDKISFQATEGQIRGTIYGPEAGLKLSSDSRVSLTRAVVSNLGLVLKSTLEITGADMPGVDAPAADKPAADKPATVTPEGNVQWAKGQAVEILWGAKWWKGRILAVDEAAGKYRVHYDGWGDNWDEWITPEKLR